ncbi:hypothetical protein A4A49_56914 [Nicotiana attenuata]|uniref:Uncharacterized protein n=1 Tax=Nicotiana attenuata TaxID=49451 RepID=A0A1J6KLB9_NICAT|nr:hypothetical protein A4A49_56914 [Nicotiana attenuata]
MAYDDWNLNRVRRQTSDSDLERTQIQTSKWEEAEEAATDVVYFLARSTTKIKRRAAGVVDLRWCFPRR